MSFVRNKDLCLFAPSPSSLFASDTRDDEKDTDIEKGKQKYCRKIFPRKDESQMQLNKRKYDEDGFYNFEDDHNYGIF